MWKFHWKWKLMPKNFHGLNKIDSWIRGLTFLIIGNFLYFAMVSESIATEKLILNRYYTQLHPNTFTNYKKSPIGSLYGLNDWKNVKALPLEIHSNSLSHSIQNLTFKPPSSPGNMNCLASRFGSPLVRTDFTFVRSIVAMEMKEM
jgi:hypothetical protein